MSKSGKEAIMAQLGMFTPEIYDDYVASKVLLEEYGWKIKRSGRRIDLSKGDLTIEGDYTEVMLQARKLVQR